MDPAGHHCDSSNFGSTRTQKLAGILAEVEVEVGIEEKLENRGAG